LQKTAWHEELERIIRAEIVDAAARTRALKALEYTVEAKDAVIRGLLAALERRTETADAAPDAGRPHGG
jgi:hypothetical protein